MEKKIPTFSQKCIPIPTKYSYEKKLCGKAEEFLRRLRWKLFVVKNPDSVPDYENFGFNTLNSPPLDRDLTAFEDDFLAMIGNVKYKPVRNQFQDKLKDEIREIKNLDKITVFADKTKNQYRVTVAEYEKKVVNTITDVYRSVKPEVLEKVNKESAKLARTFKTTKDQTLADRIDRSTQNSSFVSFKDHKRGFPGRVETRLINPSKNNLGQISKNILDSINTTLLIETKLPLWRSSKEVVDWFKKLENKQNFTFVKLDIKDYYPSISEELLDKAIRWARRYCTITKREVEIIKHCRKNFVFFKDKIYQKQVNPDFDVTMGSKDSCELSELVGLYLLNGLKRIIKMDHQGLYRDDYKAIVNLPGPDIEKLRQKLFSFFQGHKLSVTIEAGMKQSDFLDISFDLNTGLHRPFRKEDTPPVYINVDSNHNPSIKKNLPVMISKRLSMLSSNEQVFNQESAIYNEGLRLAGYNEKVKYIPENIDQQPKRRRRRKIIYFLPPWNDAVATPIGRNLFELMKKHFKPNTLVGKLFNRNTVKIGYSNTSNMKSIITSHNVKLLNHNPDARLVTTNQRGCDCRGGIVNCPVNGECQQKDLIYSSQVSTTSGDRCYYGSCSTTFKERYRNHCSDSNLAHRREATTLSSHKWSLKDRNINFTQTWSLMKHARSYTPEIGYCNLCLTEKFLINKDMKTKNLVNKRREAFRKCPHRAKFLLSNFGSF